MSSASSKSDQLEYDPVFLNSRKEAIVIFCLWAAGLIWSVPFCYFNGYLGSDIDVDSVTTVLGIPTWLFWGIFVPWIVADLFTTWFCFFYMKDDELGEAHENEDVEEDLKDLKASESSDEERGA